MAPKVNESVSSGNVTPTEEDYDGKDTGVQIITSEDKEPKPYFIKEYLNEEKRLQMLKCSNKDKKKEFREKRQKFEMHRK